MITFAEFQPTSWSDFTCWQRFFSVPHHMTVCLSTIQILLSGPVQILLFVDWACFFIRCSGSGLSSWFFRWAVSLWHSSAPGSGQLY